jgi:hypothetical protein
VAFRESFPKTLQGTERNYSRYKDGTKFGKGKGLVETLDLGLGLTFWMRNKEDLRREVCWELERWKRTDAVVDWARAKGDEEADSEEPKSVLAPQADSSSVDFILQQFLNDNQIAAYRYSKDVCLLRTAFTMDGGNDQRIVDAAGTILLLSNPAVLVSVFGAYDFSQLPTYIVYRSARLNPMENPPCTGSSTG